MDSTAIIAARRYVAFAYGLSLTDSEIDAMHFADWFIAGEYDSFESAWNARQELARQEMSDAIMRLLEPVGWLV